MKFVFVVFICLSTRAIAQNSDSTLFSRFISDDNEKFQPNLIEASLVVHRANAAPVGSTAPFRVLSYAFLLGTTGNRPVFNPIIPHIHTLPGRKAFGPQYNAVTIRAFKDTSKAVRAMFEPIEALVKRKGKAGGDKSSGGGGSGIDLPLLIPVSSNGDSNESDFKAIADSEFEYVAYLLKTHQCNYKLMRWYKRLEQSAGSWKERAIKRARFIAYIQHTC